MQTPTNTLPNTAITKELFNNLTIGWNEEFVKTVFWEDKANAILSIPLGIGQVLDKLIWALIDNGVFTIKSSYFLDLNRKQKGRGSPSNSG